ncbi:GlcG/HbpS family heme-binding protein [Rhizobium sp. 11515TR]|uniref:GlcG/HbpS family heme-binding protein n=1 Tax=Rhizobium sp. 11515TR TaxID=2028343 RepID=UPI000BA84ACB|nr:heme-binding protein [Rhizobium sp. 11515TR]ASW09870.1 hypothetical protein CKA34_28000 [Rhizobium sp. 11515TR]
MSIIDLAGAQELVKAVLQAARKRDLKPMAVAVLDERASVRALASEDGAAIGHPNIAVGKASAALAVNIGTRALAQSAAERPYYVAGLVQAVGAFIPLPGGVLVRDNGKIIGAVGVTGDSPDNDEVVAVEGIKLVGLTPDTGV